MLMRPGTERRLAENVHSLTAMVVDLDDVADAALVEIARRIDGYQYVCHSTHSYTPTMGCYRLVFRLSRPVLAREWPEFWPRFMHFFQLPADPACKDLFRLYFFPSAPYDAPVVVESGHGKPVEVDLILRMKSPDLPHESVGRLAAPQDSSPAGPAAFDLEAVRIALHRLRRPESAALAARIMAHEPLAAVGARDATINAAASLLATILDEPMAEASAVALLEPGIRKMPVEPEGAEAWLDKARHSYRRALLRRGKKDAQAKADRAALMRVAGADPVPAPSTELGAEPPGDEWRQSLIVKRDKDGNVAGVLPCEANIEIILQHDPRWARQLRFNEVTKTINVLGGPLHGVPAGDLDFAAATWLQRSEYRLMAKPFQVGPALLRVSRTQSYDPLAEYLEGLRWDGASRLNSFFAAITGSSTSALLALLGRKWVISAVARALSPGCKVDNVLILQGKYGTKKTSFVEVMAGEFYSNGKVDFTSKDSRMLAARYWLIELAEMSGYRRADKETVKDWLSTRIDSYRPPYGRVVEDFPRRAIFVGTANDDDFLPEPNRREWPVRVGEIDIEKLRLDRDQIFAEAVYIYNAAQGCVHCATWPHHRCPEHSWWLDGESARAMVEVAKEFSTPDPIQDMMTDWWFRMPVMRRPSEFQAHEAVMEALNLTRDRVTSGLLRDAGRALIALGFGRHRLRRNGSPVWVYRATPALAQAPEGERPRAVSLVEGGKTA